MNIIFIASVYRHLTAFHIPYIQILQQQGYTLFAGGSGQEDRVILESYGVKCIDIPFDRSPLSKNNVQAIKALKRLFAKEQFELVHVHTPVAAFLVRFVLRKQARPKVVYTAHGFHFFKGAPLVNRLIFYPLEKIAARWMDHLITINDEDFASSRRLMISQENVSLVHGVGVEQQFGGISEEHLQQLKEELEIGADDFVISYVAELNGNKNQSFLLRNWAQILGQCPNAKLLLIGTGELHPELKRYVVEHQLQGIQFLGYRRDVQSILKLTDVVALLSYREGLPKSIMEAMLEGIPCIVTNTRGLRDLIQDGHNGFVVEQNDDQHLVECFKLLINSNELQENMSKNAIQAIQPYLLSEVKKEYAEIYDVLLKER